MPLGSDIVGLGSRTAVRSLMHGAANDQYVPILLKKSGTTRVHPTPQNIVLRSGECSPQGSVKEHFART